MPENQEVYQTLKNLYLSLPYTKSLNIHFEKAQGRIQYLSTEAYIAPPNGHIHGGVITTLIDIAGATAVVANLASLQNIATLDMRIDYLQPAQSGKITAQAECYQINGEIAFVRTLCFQGEVLIATGTATYIHTPIPAHILEKAGKQ